LDSPPTFATEQAASEIDESLHNILNTIHRERYREVIITATNPLNECLMNVVVPGKPRQVPLLEETQSTHGPPIPAMTLEDALKVLKVTTSTPWESIETSRRQAVERARPDRLASLSKEKRSAVKEEARVANAAYLVLLQARSV
jgi:DnaJ-domain-containing protein 1